MVIPYRGTGQSADGRSQVEVSELETERAKVRVTWREGDKAAGEATGPLRLGYGKHGSRRLLRIFIVPGGRGLALFDPYGETLLTFLDRDACVVAQYARDEVLAEGERRWPVSDCACSARLPQFDALPAYASEGWEIEFAASGTGRKIRFFLPLGLQVPADFAERLPDLLSSSKERKEALGREAAAAMRDLGDDDPAAREKAEARVLACGPFALPAVRAAAGKPGDEGLRAKALLERLKPYEAFHARGLADDRSFLESLRSHPSERVRAAAAARRAELPPEKQ